MLPRNHPDQIQITFDDCRLVANAGLLLPATLAQHLGLRELVDHHLEDLAAQAVAAGSQIENSVADAAEPETFTFEELLRLLASGVGACVRLVHTSTFLGFALTQMVGLLLQDVVRTRDEVDGLMAGLLTSGGAPTGITRLARR